MRLIGLDYGSKTVGVAISDPSGILASPVETIWRQEEVNLKQTVRRIRSLCEEYEVHTIILGFPKNMNNTIGERAEKVLGFQRRLDGIFIRFRLCYGMSGCQPDKQKSLC